MGTEKVGMGEAVRCLVHIVLAFAGYLWILPPPDVKLGVGYMLGFVAYSFAWLCLMVMLLMRWERITDAFWDSVEANQRDKEEGRG
jgi:hypothetical protein